MPGLGPAAARNSALALASGEFVAFLDSDDMWLPQKLGMQLEALARDPEAGFSFTDFAEFDDEGRVGTAGHSIPPALKGAIYPALLEIRHNLITTPSVMVRRRLVAEAGGFDESMRLCEDIDLWARVARRTRCVPVRVPLVAVHVRPEAVFPYRASLAARLSLYRRAREADPGLALGFLAWLHEEMLQVYLQVAQARGDGEASALLLAAADRGRLALGAAPAARLSALEAAVAGLVASLAEAEPAGPTCGPVGRPHSGSPAPD